jgi:hypothetical protein
MKFTTEYTECTEENLSLIFIISEFQRQIPSLQLQNKSLCVLCELCGQ